MRVSANPNLMRFNPTHAPAPAEWKSKQAKRLYEAGVEGERTNPYCHNTVIVAYKPGDRWMSKYGTAPSVAALKVQMELAKVRAECDRIEKILATHGGEAFVVPRQAVRIPFFGKATPAQGGRYEGSGAAVEAFLISVMNQSDAIWINEIPFVKDSSNAYVRATPQTPEMEAMVGRIMAEHARNPTGRGPAALEAPAVVEIADELRDE